MRSPSIVPRPAAVSGGCLATLIAIVLTVAVNLALLAIGVWVVVEVLKHTGVIG